MPSLPFRVAVLAFAMVAALSRAGTCATPCNSSTLAPFFPVGSDSLDPDLAQLRVVCPEPSGEWHIVLDTLDPLAVDSLARAALALSRYQRHPDSLCLDVGIVEGVVTGIAQSSAMASVFKVSLELQRVWARRGLEPARSGSGPLEFVMLGNLAECPDRRTVYHPYPCVGDTLMARVVANADLFDGCLCTFESRWLLLNGVAERERSRLRAAAARFVAQ